MTDIAHAQAIEQDFGDDFTFEAQHDGATIDADSLFIDKSGKSKGFFRRVSSAVKKSVKKVKDRRESRRESRRVSMCESRRSSKMHRSSKKLKKAASKMFVGGSSSKKGGSGSTESLLGGGSIGGAGPTALGDCTNGGSRGSFSGSFKMSKRKAEDHCHTPGRNGPKRANINSLMYTPKKKIDLIVQDSFDYNASPGKGAGSRKAVGNATFSSRMDAEILVDMSKREIGRQETTMEFDNIERGYREKLVFQHKTYQNPIEGDASKQEQERRTFGLDQFKCEKIFGNLNNIRLAHTGGMVLMGEHDVQEKREPSTDEEAGEFESILREDELLDDADKKVVCYGVRTCVSLSTRIDQARLNSNGGHFGPLTNLGAVVLGWIKDGGLDHYPRYCCNIVTARQTLRHEVEKQVANSQQMLYAFLAIGKTIKGGKRQMLEDLLDLPRRQLQRYPLLLKEVLKYTPDTDADYGPLKEAIAACEAICNETNGKIMETDGARLVQIHNNLDFSHATPYQKINVLDFDHVMDAKAYNMKDNKRLNLYLFKELLLLTKDSKHTHGKEQVTGLPIYLHNLDVTVGKAQDGQDEATKKQAACMLEIKNSDPHFNTKHSTRKGTLSRGGSGKAGKTYIVRFKDEAERDLWVEELKHQQQEMIQSNTKTSFA